MMPPACAGLGDIVDLEKHPLRSDAYRATCRATLDREGAVLLKDFLLPAAAAFLVDEAERLRPLAYFSEQTHTVYLEESDSTMPADDARSRAVVSTKGAVTTDLIPGSSVLNRLYDSPTFQSFIGDVLGEEELHRYADPLSSININYFFEGQELGWHFDNSSFAVTLLLQQAEAGGVFEYIDGMRSSADDRQNPVAVAAVLDGRSDRQVVVLGQRAGGLALFRGRDALHRVTPVVGSRARILVVLAYNVEPGLSLSENARRTFFGRLD